MTENEYGGAENMNNELGVRPVRQFGVWVEDGEAF